MRPQIVRAVIGGAFACLPATALAETQSYIDLQAGLGYSTNPLLITDDIDDTDDNLGSAFGRLSAYGFHGWSTERSTTNLSAYLENSTYFHRYSNKQAFSLAATTNHAVSEKVRVFGDLGFSGDVSGQLSSRFYGVPPGSVVIDPTVPDGFVGVDPALYAFDERQYRLSGQIGFSATLSQRDSVTGAIGAQHVFLGGDQDELNYTQYDGSLGYDRQINERVTVGGRLIAQYSDYASGGSVTSLGPQATVRARLDDHWDASAAVGFVRTKQELGTGGEDDSSIDLALDGSICRNSEFERMCARVARRTQSSIVGGAPTSTSASFDYYRRLGAKDTIQATASVYRSDNIRGLDLDQNSSLYTLAGSYDRLLNDRLSAGVNLAARKLTTFGPNPEADLGGSIFVRYRIGDVK